jgi:precorrin-6B methylase 2
MALLWSRDRAGTRYELRSAGRTRRLYSNRVLHSQYHPDRLLTGSVWDLLWLPALWMPAPGPRRILVLGAGAGSILHPLRRLFDPERLVAVERDPVHLSVGRRHFALASTGARIVEGDARRYLRRYRGRPYDLIIDDLYGHAGGEPERSVAMDETWGGRLLNALSPDGLLVANFLDYRELADSALLREPVRGHWQCAYRLTHPKLENVVAAFARGDIDSRRERVQTHLLRPAGALAAVRRHRLRLSARGAAHRRSV